jgi:tol-pal system protein YbgF
MKYHGTGIFNLNKGRFRQERGHMRENRTWLFLLCVGVLFAGSLAGCASTSETTTLQENLSILNQRQAAIESRLQNSEGANKKSGDVYARMEELQNQMRTLNGKIEQLEHKLDQIQRAQASAPPPQASQPSAPVSGNVLMEEESSPAPQQPHLPPRSSVEVEQPSAEASPRTASVTRPEAPPQGKNAEQTEFDRAVQLMQQKKYDAARKELQAFMAKHPKSGLEESALYDIGECYYMEKHYEDAIKAYQQVVDKYPQGGRTAGALLKEGMGWQQMGENTMARIIYSRLVEKFPGTSQAKAAEKRLQQM